MAKKIRRAADSLAARKGEPGNEIGFIKIIGKVDSELFQLHTAYDDFNEAMFTEFANRGLQTQSATTCVGSLELYDAFHASENEHNREVFTAYLHATLAVSRAEWLAEMMQIAIRPLRRQYKHVEPNNAGNPAATKALRDWHAEKEKIKAAKEGIPIRRARTEITEEDKAWEQPDVAKAADLTTLPTTPPPDKAIREDVPDFGPTTTVENIADCINDVVVQDAEGNVSYQPPSDVDLVDDGDYDVPIQSSMGRVIEDPAEGRCLEDMHRFDFMAEACLPDPGRTEEQRVLRAGAHYSSSSQAIAPGKLVYYARCEVEPLRTLRLTDDVCSVPIGFTYMGAFLPPRLVMHTPDARRILTFDGEVSITGQTNVEVREELRQKSIPLATMAWQLARSGLPGLSGLPFRM